MTSYIERIFKLFVLFSSILLPWKFKRILLQGFIGYELHPKSKIGISFIFPDKLVMERESRIGHLTVCKGLKTLILKEYSSIGRGNWITGYPKEGKVFFQNQIDRVPQLIIGEHAAITHRHLLDCTNSVTIGKFTTLAGYRTQIITHSIDLKNCVQNAKAIIIGDYCFIGTNCVLLGGSVLPNYSVLGAKSLLNKNYDECYCLYGGVPATPLKKLFKEMKYFTRLVGLVK